MVVFDLDNRKADFLRYLVLLAEGGVYSDADTRALMPLSHWADNTGEWKIGTATPEPIRIIISVEGDFRIWRDIESL